jgi:hypothetical protein
MAKAVVTGFLPEGCLWTDPKLMQSGIIFSYGFKDCTRSFIEFFSVRDLGAISLEAR